MLFISSRTLERSRIKCGQYWPLDGEQGEQYGDIVLVSVGRQEHKDNIFTTLLLQCTKVSVLP